MQIHEQVEPMSLSVSMISKLSERTYKKLFDNIFLQLILFQVFFKDNILKHNDVSI